MPRRTSKISERKRLANQRNAKKSTGPKTLKGKKRSSMNAITHGVFCQEVCILKEDRPLFVELRREFIGTLKPQNLLELSFVDAIIETHWKLRRMRITEALAHEHELREHLKEEKKDFDKEMQSKSDPDYCAVVAAMKMMDREPDNLEKYTRLQQRLQSMVHRNLKELRLFRENQKELDALPPSPFEKTVDQVKYGIEDGKTLDEIYNGPAKDKAEPPVRQEEEEVEEEEVEDVDESAERSQTSSDGSPSSQPSPSEGEGVKAAPSTAQQPSTAASMAVNPPVPPSVPAKIQNEPTEFRNYDADTTCDPSWALPTLGLPFGDPPSRG